MQILYSLRLPPDVESVPLVRGILRSSMEQLGVDRRCVADVALAVTEACANVITHARGVGHDYEVQVEFDPDACHIRVIDTGDGFDPAAIEQAGDFAESGRGVTLMRALVDDLHFMPRGDGEQSGTMVHLTKRLFLDAGSALKALAVNPDGA
ncbi:ATP-binding protein [Acidiferrimicrobium sp. IK]|uniref:ATP-binding protein n=1 Tax=Acidiferrimicrobium sp. IK TaxID=2871700 RepID=UPI0021CB4BEB|nr:ATP-binding protein [Acidiferrimicrobium sp. IK]MCU4185440.1 ATP-binding protein [Acidiferrimicrobium sp. IK]